MCDLEDIMSQCPTLDALGILVERERRQEIITFLRIVTSLVLPNGKLCIGRRDRRILYMYILRHSQRSIADKVNMSQPAVLKRIKVMSQRILRCRGGHLVDWDVFLRPPQSIKEAHAPEEMIRWTIDTSQVSWVDSGWNEAIKGVRKGYVKEKPKSGRWAWEHKVKCMVPEYFKASFGDKETRCTLCGNQCTRKKRP